jgi:hypothetical protein
LLSAGEIPGLHRNLSFASGVLIRTLAKQPIAPAGPGRGRPENMPEVVNQFTQVPARPCFRLPSTTRGRDMTYSGFQIETFEAGRGLWHARIKRADLQPVIIDGVSFPELEVGFAWSDADAAVADARSRIDYLNQRSGNAEPGRKAAHA